MEHIVLLHGLGRSRASMLLPAARLRRRWHVHNVGYPSTRLPVETLAARVAERLAAVPAPFHAVTHSMGGILVRAMARDLAFAARLGRVVMLAPPNGGSQIVDRFGAWAPFGWIGPAARQLGTREGARACDGIEALPAALGPVPFACGVIAGDRPLGPDPAELVPPAFSVPPTLPAPHDGKVSVASTRVAGMADHLVLPVGHTFIMNDRAVLDAVERFLENGRF